jgi:hypothetical protein
MFPDRTITRVQTCAFSQVADAGVNLADRLETKS